MLSAYQRGFCWLWSFGLAAGLVMCWPTEAKAFDCTPPVACYGNEFVERGYRVNKDSFAQIGIHPEEGLTAVITAADLWNEQGNSGTFRYLGTTDLGTARSVSDIDCEVDDSYVTVTQDACHPVQPFGTSTGLAAWPCNREKIAIWICPDHLWGVGDTAPGEADLLETLVHEFGHHFCLDDNPQPPSVMQQLNRKLDLYEWDVKCAAQLAGYRQLVDAFRLHNSDGSFSVEDSHHSLHLKIAAGASWSTGSLRKSRIWTTFGYSPANRCLHWSWLNGTGDSGCVADLNYMGLTLATWREEVGEDDFIIAVVPNEAPLGSLLSNHQLGALFSDDFTVFPGNARAGVFWEANGGGVIKTARPLAVAYDTIQNTTISAWVRQNRGQPDNWQIRVSRGQNIQTQDENGLWRIFVGASSDLAGARSIVSPGLACHESDAGGRNCIIAYVEKDDPESQYVLNRVLIKRFTVWGTFNSPSVDLDPTTYRVVDNSVTPSIKFRTASRIAAWYRAGRFWIAVRQLKRGQQQLEVASSPDGAVWTAGPDLGYSSLGPTVAPYFFGKNVLLYSRDITYYP